jgi:hypothetical protein
LAAVWVLGMAATVLCAAVVVVGYGVAVQHWIEAFFVLAVMVACAAALGGLLGGWVRKSIVVAPLVVGLTLPFYLDSGALEPQRFDGEFLFWGAHIAPPYYAVGAAEHAFLDLKVTPESWLVLLGVLLVTAVVALGALRWTVNRR